MAKIVLGIGTSHTPLLSLPPEMWPQYAKNDERNPELSFPPHGYVMSYQQAAESLQAEGKSRYEGAEPFAEPGGALQDGPGHPGRPRSRMPSRT